MDLSKTFDFTGKTAIITGGAGVLCSELARALAACGARVVLLGRTQATLDEVAREIRGLGGDVLGIAADVLDKGQLRNAAERAISKFGHIDILINGAGGARKDATTAPGLSFFELPEDAIRWVFDLNFMGTFLACQVFGKYMVEQESGAILNIASMGAYKPLTRSVAYSAAKAAIVNFTQWLAVNLCQEHESKVRVNAIAPGFVLTEQNRFLLVDEQTGGLTERGSRIIAQTPVSRFGEPSDLVVPSLMLLSDNVPYVNGTVVCVDGGISAYGGV